MDNLLEIILLKTLLREQWIKRLDRKGEMLFFSIDQEGRPCLDKVVQLVQKKRHTYRITPEGIIAVKMAPGHGEPIEEAKKALQELF